MYKTKRTREYLNKRSSEKLLNKIVERSYYILLIIALVWMTGLFAPKPVNGWVDETAPEYGSAEWMTYFANEMESHGETNWQQYL